MPSGTATAQAVAVTVDNFRRAETDMYFGSVVRDGGLGRFRHHRELVPVDRQTVVRSNRDTLYSSGVFDLDAGPVTVTLPDAGERFRSMIGIDQDHYVRGVVYDQGTYSYDRKQIGSRYVLLAIRTLLDPGKPGDLEQVHALQDAIEASQKRPGSFSVPQWDPVGQKKVRDALLLLATTVPDTKHMFGNRDEVDPVRHLIGTAMGWGGNPEKDAFYLNVTPMRNDGTTVHRLRVRDVPVDGFWSITVYNAEGYLQPNPASAYSLNNLTARKSPDGSIIVQFGGCDRGVSNCLPITQGWNYLVRLYRPRPEILSRTWTFPEAQPAGAS